MMLLPVQKGLTPPLWEGQSFGSPWDSDIYRNSPCTPPCSHIIWYTTQINITNNYPSYMMKAMKRDAYIDITLWKKIIDLKSAISWDQKTTETSDWKYTNLVM